MCGIAVRVRMRVRVGVEMHMPVRAAMRALMGTEMRAGMRVQVHVQGGCEDMEGGPGRARGVACGGSRIYLAPSGSSAGREGLRPERRAPYSEVHGPVERVSERGR